MKELILLIGPPGSGKTTYCNKELIDYHRVSQDDLGKQGHWDTFTSFVSKGYNIVVDRMNFNKVQRAKYIEYVKDKNYLVKVINFCVDKEVCIARAKERKEHPTLTPEKVESVVNFFTYSYEAPSFDEGIKEIIAKIIGG